MPQRAIDTIGRRLTFNHITDDKVKITGTATTHLTYNYSRKCGALMQYQFYSSTSQFYMCVTCHLLLSYSYGKVSEKRDLACIIKKHNKNALRLKCYNFRRVNAIVFLFSAFHITPFLYGKILFGILHLLLASIATFDTPPGSNPP